MVFRKKCGWICVRPSPKLKKGILTGRSYFVLTNNYCNNVQGVARSDPGHFLLPSGSLASVVVLVQLLLWLLLLQGNSDLSVFVLCFADKNQVKITFYKLKFTLMNTPTRQFYFYIMQTNSFFINFGKILIEVSLEIRTVPLSLSQQNFAIIIKC